MNAFDSLLTLTNSTVSGNTASLAGGGIFNDYFFNLIPYSATATISNSTLTGNKARFGGGILNEGNLDLNRSLISGNIGPFGREVYHFPGTVNAANFNLFGVSGNYGLSGFAPGATDIVGAVPLASIIDPLANNGGPTYTHALPLGSPAIDAAPLVSCPATDQRGAPYSRPVGPLCDIGAFEKQ